MSWVYVRKTKKELRSNEAILFCKAKHICIK